MLCGSFRSALRGASRRPAKYAQMTGMGQSFLTQAVPSGLSTAAESALATQDPDLHAIISQEEHRQSRCLELIASENFTSTAAREVLGSCLTNKYSEGLPGQRYYGGNQYIDQVERLCQERSLRAFGLDPAEWGVNVQPLSGSSANIAAYNAVLMPHDRIMGMDLPAGGHLTHGYMTAKKRISASSRFYESMAYSVDPNSLLLDYNDISERAAMFRPRLLIAGFSAYPRSLDYASFRTIADTHGAYLLADMAHTAGLVATGLAPSPFVHCDIVTTTTHKTLRGPRAGLIFYRRSSSSIAPGVARPRSAIAYGSELGDSVNFSVFPMLQGGPHQNAIGAVATAMLEVMQPSFTDYQAQVLANCKTLASELQSRGFAMATGGSDNHLLLVLLTGKGIDGARVESTLEQCSITVNKNTTVTDTSALVPSAIRLGTPALTSRGLREPDFAVVAELVDEGVEIARALAESLGKHKLSAFKDALADPASSVAPRIAALRARVESFTESFPMRGRGIESD